MSESSSDNHRGIVTAAAAIIDRDGHYLIARRKPDVHLGGFWEFPGGKCEAGESLEECLRRELLEELDELEFELGEAYFAEQRWQGHHRRCLTREAPIARAIFRARRLPRC